MTAEFFFYSLLQKKKKKKKKNQGSARFLFFSASNFSVVLFHEAGEHSENAHGKDSNLRMFHQ